jgi:hypothetical protein
MSRKKLFLIVFWTIGGWFVAPIIIAGIISAVGSIISSLSNKQKAPEAAAPVNTGLSSEEMLNANLANFPKAISLASATNQFNQSEASRMMEQVAPGYAKFASSLMKSGQDKINNQYKVPAEVEQNLSRIASERGISAGTRGQFNQFGLLRDLGVNELQYGQQQFNDAMAALQTVTGTAPRVSPMSPVSFMVTPQQQLQTDQSNQSAAQSALNANAAASNWNQMNTWKSISEGISNVYNTYLQSQKGTGSTQKAPVI